MNLAVAVLLYACVSPSEQGLSSTVLYKCPAPPLITETIAPERPAQAAMPPLIAETLAPEKPRQITVKPMRAIKPKPRTVIPSWVASRPTKCLRGTAKWYFRGYWRYRCPT
ncbi:hypothetical protein BH10PSE7_BH10PSE7_28800 [soil metagenome]